MTVATTLAHHFPTLPAPFEYPDGGVYYAISAHVTLTVEIFSGHCIATLSAADRLGLARPRAEGEAATPEAAVAAVIRDGGHILSHAAYIAAQEIRAMAALLGTDHAHRISAALTTPEPAP